jgi:hypothetical protein
MASDAPPKRNPAQLLIGGVSVVCLVGLAGILLSGPPPVPTPLPLPSETPPPPVYRLELEPALLFEGSYRSWPKESRARIELKIEGHPARSVSAHARSLKFKEPLPRDARAYRAQIMTPDGPRIAGLELKPGKDALGIKVWPMQPIARAVWVYLDRRGAPEVDALWIGQLRVSLKGVKGPRFQIPAPMTLEGERTKLGDEEIGRLHSKGLSSTYYLVDLRGKHSYRARTITYSVKGELGTNDTAAVLEGKRVYLLPGPTIHFNKIHFFEQAPQSFETTVFGTGYGSIQNRLEVIPLD